MRLLRTLFILLALLGCAAAPTRPTPPASAYPADRKVPLTVDAEGYPVSPTMGAMTNGWGLSGAPVVVYRLAHRDQARMAIMIDTTAGRTLFYAIFDADGQAVEWAGDATLLRPRMPGSGRAPVRIEADGR